MEDRRALAFGVPLVLVGYLAFSGGGFQPADYGPAGFGIWAFIGLLILFGPLPDARPSRGLKLTLSVFAGLVAWTALSLLWSDSAERTVDELDRLAVLAGVLALAGWGLRRDAWRSAAVGLASASVGIAVLAALFRLLPDIAPAAARVPSIADGRLAFPVEYWNGLAGLCAMALCAGVAWGAQATTPGVRGAAMASVPFSGLALYLTYSRGGVVALACGLVCIVALSRDPIAVLRLALVGLGGAALTALAAHSQEEIANGTGGSGGLLVLLVAAAIGVGGGAWAMTRGSTGKNKLARWAPKPRWALAAAVVCGAVLVVATSRGNGSRAVPQEGDPASRLVSAQTNRSTLWAAAVDGFLDHPVGGVGAGGYGLLLSHDPAATDLAADAHSLPLETGAELGLIGLVLLGSFAFALSRAAWGARRALERTRDRTAAGVMIAFTVVLAAQSLVDWVWEVTAVAVLGIGALAVLAAAANGGLRRRLSGGRRALAVGACVVLGALQVPGLVAAERTDLSKRALAFGFLRVAAEAADDATTAAPWSARAHAQQAEVALARAHLEVARIETDHAIRLEPENWEYRLLSARVAATAQDEAGARLALAEVGRLRPAVSDVMAGLSIDPLALAAPSLVGDP